MKTKLLSLILITVLFTSVASAQKTWDFGNNATTFPLSTGITSTPTVIDNLGFYANSPEASNQITNFGAITANNATFSDEYTATRRLQLNGAGYSGSTFMAMPTQRFLYFNVSGACTIKIWFKTGSNGGVRTVFVTNGNAVVGSATTNADGNGDAAILSANYTGGAGTLFVYGDAACNLYKMQVIGATVSAPVLSTNDFKLTSSVNVFSNGKQLSIANVVSETQVEVYNMTGALVKTAKTNSDTTLDMSLSAGFYIVKVRSAEGEKAVKVIMK